MTDDEEFDAVIRGAYAEEEMTTGHIGDADLTEVAPTPARPGLDLGIAGSLIQTRDELRAQRRAVRSAAVREPATLTAGAVLLAGVIVVGVLAGAGMIPGHGVLIPLLGGVAAAAVLVSGWFLVRRLGPSPAERALGSAIAAERRAGEELAAALVGTTWVLLHDRRLPHSEHRVPFVAVGPGGVALITIVPAGPYQALDGAVKAGSDELTSGWLPARVWEASYLMRCLSNVGTTGLRFTGPVWPTAMEGYPCATKIPEGWSGEPPGLIGQVMVRQPGVLAANLGYFPRVFAPHHVAQLAQLVDHHCPSAPQVIPMESPGAG